MDRFYWNLRNIGGDIPEFPFLINHAAGTPELVQEYERCRPDMIAWCRLNLKGDGLADGDSTWIAFRQGFAFSGLVALEKFRSKWAERRAAAFQPRTMERRAPRRMFIGISRDFNTDTFDHPIRLWETAKAAQACTNEKNEVSPQNKALEVEVFLGRPAPLSEVIRAVEQSGDNILVDSDPNDSLTGISRLSPHTIIANLEVRETLEKRGYDHFIQGHQNDQSSVVVWRRVNWRPIPAE